MSKRVSVVSCSMISTVAATVIAAMASGAAADVIAPGQSYYFSPTIAPPDSYDRGGTPFDLGSGFTVASSITVDALGAYEAGDPEGTLNITSPGDTFATLYASGNTTPIASVEILHGTVIEDEGFAFAELAAPLTLAPGQYFITALADYSSATTTGTSASYERYAPGTYTIGNGVSLTSETDPSAYNFSPAEPGTYPSSTDNGGITTGGNFIYSVPEPASFSLAMVAGLGLLGRRRRRAERATTL